MTRKAIRPAFVTTFVAVASAALVTTAGCGTTVQFASEGADCTFGEPGCDQPCPAAIPDDGSNCLQDEQWCSWDDCDTGRGATATCAEGSWEVQEHVVGCNPPPPEPPPSECPAELPVGGTACDAWNGPYTCAGYLDPVCGIEVTATCQADGTWLTDQIECNPPPPDFCQTLDVDACMTSAGCRWLEPGCGEPQLPAAGCFAEVACVPGACGFDETCTPAVIDPCWDSDCQACAAETAVCLPSG